MKRYHFGLLTAVSISLLQTQSAFAQTHADLGVTRTEAREAIAEVLFSQDGSSLNYDYNTWRASTDTVSDNTALSNSGLYCSHSVKGGHAGVDIQTRNSVGTTVSEPFFAVDSGIVTNSGGSLGTIAVFNEQTNRTVIYLHARSIYVNTGDEVRIGDELGIQGDEGIGGSREHVHIEVIAGEQNRPVCGADSPSNNNKVTVDPVAYLYSRVGKEADPDNNERALRIAASKALPSLVSSSNSHMRCDGRFQVDFTFDTYSSKEDLSISVQLYDDRENYITGETFTDSDLQNDGTTGFVLTSGTVQQNRILIRERISLSNTERNDLEDTALIRVFQANRPVQNTLPIFEGVNWGQSFTMLVPKILDENLGSESQAYERGTQARAQRYLEIDTGNCR